MRPAVPKQFQNLTDVLDTDRQFIPSSVVVQSETSARQDSDPATNSFISVSWADLEADTWPGVDMAALFTANFVTAPTFTGSTNINFVSVGTDPTRTFMATSATINAIDVVNHDPVLGAIGNKTVDEGTPLTFTVSATDAYRMPSNSTPARGLWARTNVADTGAGVANTTAMARRSTPSVPVTIHPPAR